MAESSISLRLVNIDTVLKTVFPQPEDFEGAFFSFDVSTESRVEKEKKFIIQFVKAIVRDGNKREPLATFTFAFIFNIENFDEHITANKEGLYEIPVQVEIYLKTASISSARGIIWSELKGSYLHYAIMPIIDVTTLTPSEQKIIPEKGVIMH